MATPARRKGSSSYQFRKVTPKDIWEARDALSQHGIRVPREVTKTLKTASPSDARKAHSKLSAAWEAEWQTWRRLLRDGPITLSAKQIAALTGDIARQLIAGDVQTGADEPIELEGIAKPLRVTTEHGALMAELLEAGKLSASTQAVLEVLMDRALRRLPGDTVHIDKASRSQLLSRLITDLPKHYRMLGAMEEGDYREPDWLQGRPHITASFSKPVTFSSLIDGWSKSDRQPEPGTVKAYRVRLKGFTDWLGHEDASRVTRKDGLAWRETLLTGENLKGAKHKLSDLKTIINWGMASGKLGFAVSPLEGITISLKKHKKQVEAFTDDEARIMLGASRMQEGWLRWGPWLLAYTGARIGELVQLRVADVGHARGTRSWTLSFIPEAGRLKTRESERIIPLHSAVISEGFAAYVASLKPKGHLFPELWAGLELGQGREKDSKTLNMVERRARLLVHKMIKAIDGFALPAKRSINHSWRHRMTTLCRTYFLTEAGRNALLGHADGSGADSGYGGPQGLRKLREEVERIPALELPAAKRGGLNVRKVSRLKASKPSVKKVKLKPKAKTGPTLRLKRPTNVTIAPGIFQARKVPPFMKS